MRWLLFIIAMLSTAIVPARAQERLKVVTSFSILGDFIRNVGGDRIELTTLVGPNSDAHVYSPTPADARKIADARLVIVNGLGFEGWLPRLVQSSGSKATVVTASTYITPRKLGGYPDPHAWQTVANAKTYVNNIRVALSTAAPADAEIFRANAEAYGAKLDALEDEIRQLTAEIQWPERKLISNHTAFSYFAAAYGFEFIAPVGISTDAEPSARDIAAIITQIKKTKVPIPAIFLENVSDPRLIERIAAETGAKVGGALYSDSLTDEKGDAPTYIDMMRHNITTLKRALSIPRPNVR